MYSDSAELLHTINPIQIIGTTTLCIYNMYNMYVCEPAYMWRWLDLLGIVVLSGTYIIHALTHLLFHSLQPFSRNSSTNSFPRSSPIRMTLRIHYRLCYLHTTYRGWAQSITLAYATNCAVCINSGHMQLQNWVERRTPSDSYQLCKSIVCKYYHFLRG